MSNDRKQDLHTLHTLLNTTIDGVKGYAKACDECESASPHFREYLQNARHECQVAGDEIRSLLASCGESADENGTLKGDLHRGWIGTRAAFSANEEAVFAAEVVRGEENAVKTYEDALEKLKTQSFRTAIEAQLLGVRANLTKARAFEKHIKA